MDTEWERLKQYLGTNISFQNHYNYLASYGPMDMTASLLRLLISDKRALCRILLMPSPRSAPTCRGTSDGLMDGSLYLCFIRFILRQCVVTNILCFLIDSTPNEPSSVIDHFKKVKDYNYQ